MSLSSFVGPYMGPTCDSVAACVRDDYMRGRIDADQFDAELDVVILKGRWPDRLVQGMPPITCEGMGTKGERR